MARKPRLATWGAATPEPRGEGEGTVAGAQRQSQAVGEGPDPRPISLPFFWFLLAPGFGQRHPEEGPELATEASLPGGTAQGGGGQRGANRRFPTPQLVANADGVSSLLRLPGTVWPVRWCLIFTLNCVAHPPGVSPAQQLA